MAVKPCIYCQCPTKFDSTINKDFTKKDGSKGHGWFREDLSKLEHTRERCNNFKNSKEFMEKESVQNAQTNPNVETAPSPLMPKEMDVADIASDKLRRETLVNLKVLKVIEEEIIKFLGPDTRGDKIGMWMKLVMEMNKNDS